MLNILLSIIAIALAAIVIAGGSWYFDSGIAVRKEAELMATSGFGALTSGYNAYRSSNQQILPQTDWQKTLTDDFIYMPNKPANMDWSYKYDTMTPTDHWFCLSGTITARQYQGLVKAKGKLSLDNTFLGSACGQNNYEAIPPASFPTAVALTYKL